LKCIELLQGLKEACVLITTPCQLEGILKYIRLCDPPLEEKIDLKVGLICGWMYSDHAVAAFTEYKGIKDKVGEITYRGEDHVGSIKIKTPSATHKFHRERFGTLKERIDYRTAFSTASNRLRCRVCQDHMNLLSDVVVGDAWLERKKDQKLSIIIIRNSKGSKLIRDMTAQGDLVIEKSTFADLVKSQSRNLVYGDEAKQLGVYLREKSKITPDFVFDSMPIKDKVALSLIRRFQFGLEFGLRNVLRKGDYKKFKLLYITKSCLNLLKESKVMRPLRKLADTVYGWKRLK